MKNKKTLLINIIIFVGLLLFGIFVLLSLISDYLYKDIYKLLNLTWLERNNNTISYILFPIVIIGLIYSAYKSRKK